jgi:hypothetical protein
LNKDGLPAYLVPDANSSFNWRWLDTDQLRGQSHFATCRQSHCQCFCLLSRKASLLNQCFCFKNG